MHYHLMFLTTLKAGITESILRPIPIKEIMLKCFLTKHHGKLKYLVSLFSSKLSDQYLAYQKCASEKQVQNGS